MNAKAQKSNKPRYISKAERALLESKVEESAETNVEEQVTTKIEEQISSADQEA